MSRSEAEARVAEGGANAKTSLRAPARLSSAGSRAAGPREDT